ncbi:MAG TPA: proton-conducting transporter membrane subunit, partial [Anaerolineales bacterium]
MNASQLLMLSVVIFGLGSLASLFLNGGAARAASGLTGMAGSVFGVLAVIASFMSPSNGLSLPVALPFGQLTFEMDGLSMLMVAMICVVSFAVSLYSLSYTLNGQDEGYGLLGFLMNLFTAIMLLVVTVSNTFYFLVFWEMMTLVSYFLVTFESRQEKAVRAGYLYMLIAHAGGALIMLAILLFFINSGSFEFSALRTASLSAPLRSLIFLLAFIGFGAKAGMVPLHMWMPPAYAAAPSNAAALMSTVMKKTAIYGILRFCVDLLGPSVLWWGMLVLLFGVVSAGLGALFALSERQMKRVLAYSSI